MGDSIIVLGDGVLLVIIIFLLRVLNNAIGTMRVIILTRHQRGLAFVLAFIESCIFAFTAAQVLTDLTNIANFIAYAAGFAVGGWVGMELEERFITSYVTFNIITPQKGHEIALQLREEGYGVTETHAEGGAGHVTMLRVVTHRQLAPQILATIRRIHPEAFVTTEEARAVHRGWLQNRKLLRR